ncbi:MAG: TAXI family TRAP transporter solute-binding subunit [Hyphomicrobiales bacterium]|nr:TAXI family TRAP transporter solute-binding subunit [Hyphomicrobiales bacterium]
MRRLLCIASVLVSTISCALVLAIPAEAQPERRFISIGTGDTSGVYVAAGKAICRMVEEERYAATAKGSPLAFHCVSPETRGSAENLIELARRNLDFGLVRSDLQFLAYTHSDPDRVSAFPQLRSVFSLYSEPLHVVVADESSIYGFADLAGMRVNFGEGGGGHREIMEHLMRRYRLKQADFAVVSALPPLNVSQALCRGEIDAFALTAGVPSSIVALATDGCRARIIPLDTEVERVLAEDRSYYVRATIPASSYRTVKADTPTVGVVSTLVTRAGVDDDVIYAVTKAVMRNLRTFRLLHPAFADLEPKRMIGDGLTAPLHPGARRYYVEQGWMDESDMIQSENTTSPRTARPMIAVKDATGQPPPETKAIARGAVPMVFPQGQH